MEPWHVDQRTIPGSYVSVRSGWSPRCVGLAGDLRGGRDGHRGPRRRCALKTGGNTVVIEADLRDPRAILDHPGTRKLIDFSQPLAVLAVAVLHFISDDDDPPAIVAAIRDAVQPGSYLVLSQVTGDIRSSSSSRQQQDGHACAQRDPCATIMRRSTKPTAVTVAARTRSRLIAGRTARTGRS
jgi:hypothetical protein